MSRVVSAEPALVAPVERESGLAIGSRATALPRILCVDDEPAILTMLERALCSQFEVVTLDDPVAALALIEHGRFSVIMSDMRMPSMPGTAFLEQARTLAPTSMRLAFTAGLDWQLPPDIAFGVLTKPCPLPLLQATVSAAAQCHALIGAQPGAERPMSYTSSKASASGPVSGTSPVCISSAPRAIESGLRPRDLELGRSSGAPAAGASSLPAANPRRLALSLLGKVVELWPRATLLGRAMDCDVVVVDDRISPRHLRLFRSWRGVTIQDVSVKSNVRLNGEPLVGVRFIQPGDCIGLGPFDVRVLDLDAR
jgi:CheY-like chemotaxis protein